MAAGPKTFLMQIIHDATYCLTEEKAASILRNLHHGLGYAKAADLIRYETWRDLYALSQKTDDPMSTLRDVVDKAAEAIPELPWGTYEELRDHDLNRIGILQ
jgi:hypothetical protein